MSSEMIIQMIAMVRGQALAQHKDIQSRLSRLETTVGWCSQTVPPLNHSKGPLGLGLNTTIMGDTPLGTAVVGTTETTLPTCSSILYVSSKQKWWFSLSDPRTREYLSTTWHLPLNQSILFGLPS